MRWKLNMMKFTEFWSTNMWQGERDSQTQTQRDIEKKREMQGYV